MKSSFCHNKFNTFIGIITKSWYKSEKIIHLQHNHHHTPPVLCNSATCQWNLFNTFNIIKQRFIYINITLHLCFCPITVHLKLGTAWKVSEIKHLSLLMISIYLIHCATTVLHIYIYMESKYWTWLLPHKYLQFSRSMKSGSIIPGNGWDRYCHNWVFKEVSCSECHFVKLQVNHRCKPKSNLY
jgi:hypothetical protein